MRTMRLRTATLDDLNTILQHRVEMYREMGRDDPHELAITERVSRVYFENALADDNYHSILAEVEGVGVVGGAGVVVIHGPGPGNARVPAEPGF